MKTHNLSIIIPIYNGEKYISCCLDSIFSLPLSAEELEVIVVDDCSTDGTLNILNQYQQAHSNLIVLRQEKNQRQGAARNRGIAIAKGEYIAFADADDEIVCEGFINAFNAVEKSHVDICYFDSEYEFPSGIWNKIEMPLELHNTVISSKQYLNNHYTCNYNAPWRCLYKTDFLRDTGIRFVEGVRWEDCDWTVKVYSKAKEIQFVDGVGYRYTYSPTQTSNQQSPLVSVEHLYAGLRLLELAVNIGTSLPTLANTLTVEAHKRYVSAYLSFYAMNRTKWHNLKSLYEIADKKIPTLRQQLTQYCDNKWILFTLKHKYLTLFLMFLLRPEMVLYRKIQKIHS